MNLKLKDNPKLELDDSGLFVEKITTLYINNCNNINGLDIIRAIQSAQSSLPAAQKLNRVRVDIGNVSGSYDELMQFSTLEGFNDNYEHQIKPRLIGTFTITGYIFQSHLSTAQATFDGLTILAENIIDWNDCLAQSIDENQPNYNPAVVLYYKSSAIVFNFDDGSKGAVVLVSHKNVSEVTFMTQNGNFGGFDSLTDDTGICKASYNQGVFTPTTYFVTNTKFLQRLTNCTTYNIGLFNCKHLSDFVIKIPQNTTTLKGKGIRCLPYDKIIELGENTTVFDGVSCYNDAANFQRYKLLLKCIPTSYIAVYPTNCVAYIGKGVSKNYDNALKDLFKISQTRGAIGAMGIYSWYDYTAPSLSYDGSTVIISVSRTQDLSALKYKKSSDSEYTSIQNNETFLWDGNGYIDAMAEYTNGDIYYSERFYAQTCATPTLTIDTTNNRVTINCATSGAIIHYTIDGSYPTHDSPIYSSAIISQEDIVKVRCFAIKEGMNDSEVVSKMCVLNDSLWGVDGDTSTFAVQCIDSTKHNYNPAVCIILYGNNKLTDLCYGGGGYITKTDAAAITSFGRMFEGKTTFKDIFNIVSNVVQTYNFSSFKEIEFFTNVNFGDYPFTSGEFRGCTNLRFDFDTIIPCSIINKGAHFGASTNFGNLTFSANLTKFGGTSPSEDSSLFRSSSNFKVHLLAETPPTIGGNIVYGAHNFKFYVGDGSSAAHDDAILAAYQAAWPGLASSIDTWYNFLYPQTT